MEKQLQTLVSQILQTQSVVGLVAADQNGFCITKHGDGSSKAAPFIRSIIVDAKSLAEDDIPPTISIETQNTKILITEAEDVTLAIYKSAA